MGGRIYTGRRPIFGGRPRRWVLDLDAQYYAQAANNTVHDIGLQDIGTWAWIKVNPGISGINVIAGKTDGGDSSYMLYMAGNVCRIWLRDADNDLYTISSATSLDDGRWYFIVAIIDRDNAGNCAVYVDGLDDTGVKSGIIGDIGTLTNTNIYSIGSYSDGSRLFDGQIAEVGIAYPADIMAPGEMGAAGEIANLYNNPGDPSQWPNSEGYWLCDEGTGTTLTGQNNDLTLSNALAWSYAPFP
jgi:hypothetical protein